MKTPRPRPFLPPRRVWKQDTFPTDVLAERVQQYSDAGWTVFTAAIREEASVVLLYRDTPPESK